SFSRQTLQTLRSLDKDTANLLAEIHPFLINNRMIVHYPTFDRFYKARQFSFEDLMNLTDAGLIHPNAISYSPLKDEALLQYAGGVISFHRGTEPTLRTAIDCHALTRPGIELLRIHKQRVDDEYLRLFVLLLRRTFAETVRWRPPGETEFREFDL